MIKKTQISIIHPDHSNFHAHMEKLYQGMLEKVSMADVLRISMRVLAPRFAEGRMMFFATAELAAEWEETK